MLVVKAVPAAMLHSSLNLAVQPIHAGEFRLFGHSWDCMI